MLTRRQKSCFFFGLYDIMDKNAVGREARKMKNKANKGIKIKINGQEKIYVADKSDKQTAAAVEPPDETFDWILPEDDEEPDKEIKHAPLNRKSSGLVAFSSLLHKLRGGNPSSALSKTIIAIAIAVICGTSLGLIVTKTITSEKELANVETTAAPSSITSTTDTTSNSAEKSDDKSNVSLTSYLVQGGVFTNEGAAKSTQVLVAQKGVPAEVFQIDKKFYLFLGTAESLEDSKKLAVFLKTYGVDVFWKEVSLKPESLSKEDAAIVTEMATIYQKLVKVTSNQLLTPSSIGNIEEINKEVASVLAAVKKNESAGLSEAGSNLKGAAELFNQYQQSNEPAQLLQAQQKLLLFLLAYKKIGSE